jgi:laminin alpha 3/5
LEFRTTHEDGILFYADGDRHVDFTSLYMKDGKVVFGYNCGSGMATIPTNNYYNDGKWHTVSIL